LSSSQSRPDNEFETDTAAAETVRGFCVSLFAILTNSDRGELVDYERDKLVG
jgi:hypothetical protein